VSGRFGLESNVEGRITDTAVKSTSVNVQRDQPERAAQRNQKRSVLDACRYRKKIEEPFMCTKKGGKGMLDQKWQYRSSERAAGKSGKKDTQGIQIGLQQEVRHSSRPDPVLCS